MHPGSTSSVTSTAVRMPDDMPRRPRRAGRGEREPRPNRTRWALGVLVAVLVVLALSLRGIATFWTDFLWFDSIDLTSVWRRLLSARLTLGIGATLVFFAILWINLLVADRLAPRFRPVAGTEDDVVLRYQELVAGRQRVLSLGLAFFVAVIPGMSVSAQWQSWLLFRFGGSFGKADPQFGTDIGFYVFKLPFLSQVVDWLFAFLIVTTVIVAVVHYLNGAIRLQPMGERVTQNAKAQISVLLALTALVKAADYVLQRYELTFAAGRSFDGAGYTAVNARIPATEFLILISVFVAVLFIINIWRRGWIMPGIVVALWVLVALVVGSVYPAFVQRFQVSPAELSKERPYIERNIEGTRQALGLGSVQAVDFDYSKPITRESIDAQVANVRDARLLDPAVIQPTVQELEFEREFYRFKDVDVDRYTVTDSEESGGGSARVPVIVSARELDEDGITNPTWEKLHLIFTHGYGLALAPANTTNSRGEPDFLVQGIPARTTGLPELKRPEIYHGEKMPGYAIVGTDQKELSTDQVSTTYEGRSGVGLDSFARRAAFALRFGEIEPLISSNLTERSKIIYVRDVAERVHTIAPYLTLDPDPYPIMVDGRIKYVIDGYTTAATYPYGQTIDMAAIDPTVPGTFNYMRNSVKAVVDAYDGTVDMYMVDRLYGAEDPVIRAYAKAFPDVYESDVPESISRHFRYPELMFELQTAVWGRYHQSDPSSFFNNSDTWSVAQQPPNTSSTPLGDTDVTTGAATANLPRIEPYYQMMQLTPDSDPEFLLTRPFVLASKDESGRNLTAMMVASNDPGSYGKLRQIVNIGSDADTGDRPKVDGPLQAHQKIVTYEPVSQYQTIVGKSGSSVRYGNMLILPFGDALLYVRPVYAKAEQSGRYALTRVAVTNGDAVGFAETIEGAIADLLDADQNGPVSPDLDGQSTGDGDTSTTVPSTDGDGGGAPDGGRSATELLAAADAKFAEADDRLKAGDLGGYQSAVADARKLVSAADAALKSSTSTTTTPPVGSTTTTTTAAPRG